MLAKLFHKNNTGQQPPPRQQKPPPAPEAAEVINEGKENKTGKENLRNEEEEVNMNPTVGIHYGIPSTSSVLAFDPIQSLLAIGTLDGRIKVIGGDNVEGLLVSSKQLPFKNLEFLQNQGFLVSITAENEIQVWDLEQRRLTSTLQWESSITAFAVIPGSSYMYVGDEYGMVSVLKYDAGEAKLVLLPYYVPTDSITEASGLSSPNQHSVVGLLPQPASQGNRLLIAFDDGLIILWDVSEDKVILTKGNNDLQLKSKSVAGFQRGMENEPPEDISEYEHLDKEISALCWASRNGSVLAVGYVDGDILFWNLSTAANANDKFEKSSNDVIKLQLSSAERRLPVIVLHWSAEGLRNDTRGQLFIYGGDTIGSEEVLTVLSIDWSSGIENLKCICRVDLTLSGTFGDMVLVRSDGVSKTRGVLALTNPGQLHFYEDACFSSIISQQQKQNYVQPMQYPIVIPIVEPRMTLAKLGLVYGDGKFSEALSKAVSAAKLQAAHERRNMNWPLTGGVPRQPDPERYQVERVYIAGYQDGSVRIWDATNPTFTLVYVLEPAVKGINISGASASISALEFCSFTLSLAVGNELGMVRLYKLIGSADETSLHVVKETEKEVHTLHHGDGPQCVAVFSFCNSPICNLQFANFGSNLAVGFHCGKVAMLCISTLSTLFMTDSISNSPVVSLAVKPCSDDISTISYPEDIESKRKEDHAKWELFVMTKDAHFAVIDGNHGSIISSQLLKSEKESNVIFMHFTGSDDLISYMPSERHSQQLIQNSEINTESNQDVIPHGSTLKIDHETASGTSYSLQIIEDYLLLCFEDALHLYSLKSLNEGNTSPIQKVNLLKPCCWTSIFKKDEKVWGLIIVYQTGEIEIRSSSDLEVLGETSLMSILSWNYKTNMEKTMCSCDAAEIMLVNTCEFASVSLVACKNNFRLPELLPCLHDKVLAAAANAAMSLPPSQNQIQGGQSSILGGLIKGLQVNKVDHGVHHPEVCTNNFDHLEAIFSSPPFLKPFADISDNPEVLPPLSKPFADISDNPEVLELNIDDVEIDGPLIISSSSEMKKDDIKDKGTEKERLFEGASSDEKPRLRTAEEIKAKYRKEDPAAAAARARDKLAERGEKLERLSQRTEELQSGAENFASMAHELAKQMEKRKWWNI